MRGTETMVYPYQQPVLFLWRAVTFSERAPTLNPFLTERKNATIGTFLTLTNNGQY